MGIWFFKRHRYTIRKVTHFQQKLPIDALEKIFNFIKEYFTTRIYYKIGENLNLLGNMDETLCWMEMKINKTIAKIGEKEISVKTFNMDQQRFSVVLCILVMEVNYLLFN